MRKDNMEAWRLGLMDEARREESQRTEKLRELNREINRLEALEIPLAQKLMQAQKFDINADVCPRCAINHGHCQA